MLTKKMFSRAIDLRANIAANPDLAGLEFEVQRTFDDEGKDKRTAKFTVTTQEEADAVAKAGYRAVMADGSAFSAAPRTKEPRVTKPKNPNGRVAPKAKSMAEKAMLANLTIKGWSGRASDKSVAEYAAQGHQANAAWISVTKALVNKTALKAIRAAEAAARATHKELTLPWHEGGARILPAAAFHDYQKKMGEHRDTHTAAVDALIAEYDDLVEEARKELGGAYDTENYPDAAQLQAKFEFDTELTTLDVTGDFRVAMSDAEMQRLQDQIQKRTEDRLSAAMTDVYRRLHDVVAHMADRLRAYNPDGEKTDADGNTVKRIENPFRDATLNNVKDIVDLMPKLNITGDPELDALAREVRQNLLEADAKTLRNDAQKREDVANKADAIVDAMGALM